MAKKNYNCKLLPFTRKDVLSIQEAEQKAGWEITAFDLPKAWEHSRGENVKIAVLDTGADLTHPDLVENLLPGINFVNPGQPPMDDCCHGCIDPECLVQTSFCGVEKIETLYNRIPSPVLINTYGGETYFTKDVRNLNIKTISLADDGSAKVSKINEVHKLHIKSNVVEIILDGNIKYLLTPWHPIYTKKYINHKKYETLRKRADSVIVGDRMIFPNKASNLITEYYESNAEFYRQCNNCGHIPNFVKRQNGKIYHCKKCRGTSWVENHKRYKVNESLAYLVGLIITDGYYNKRMNRTEISSTTKEILEKSSSIAKEFGFTPDIRKNENRILIYSKSLVSLLYNLGILEKGKSTKQTLPEFVGKSPLSVIYSFLAGVIDGDGCVSKSNTRNRITSASKDFAYGICAIFNAIGISCGVTIPKKDTRLRKILSKHDLYVPTFSAIPPEIGTLLFHPTKKHRALAHFNKRYTVRAVKSTKMQEYDGFFYDFTMSEEPNYIANGHFVSNTHVTGILVAIDNVIGMVGVAPKAKVIPVKVLDNKGNGNLITVSTGIRWAADNGADFIQMSLGAPQKVQQVRKAIQYAADRGVVTFCAAGNAGNTEEIFYPANYPETISIGAIDKDFHRAHFSNTGQNLDFMAPGVEILSTVPKNWYSILSGTSMAAPFACGVAALVLAYAKKTGQLKLKCADDYRHLFKQYTIPISDETLKNQKFYQGFGIIDPRLLEAAVEKLNPSVPH